MTLQELYSLYYIKKEIEAYKLKIEELQAMAESITQKVTGMPSGGNVSDKVGNAVVAIITYKEMLAQAIQRDIELSMKINQYILTVEDVQLRQIMFLRFIEHLTWREVAMRIGGGNTEDGVRKRCNRYVRQQEKMQKNNKLSVLSADKVI